MSDVRGDRIGSVAQPADVVAVFVQGAEVVVAALADPAVGDAWDSPSVLPDQRVSGLAGHLARGGVWVVDEYLDAGPPPGPVDFTSAAEYFATLMGTASPADHRAIRARGADIAAPGLHPLASELRLRLDVIAARLATLDAGRLIAVTGGRVLRLDHYLATRIVEQVVHLDDLARSVGHEPWPLPAGALDLAISVGTDIARLRGGDPAVVRALYRHGFAEELLPVL